MALLGRGVLVFWHGIAPHAEDEFVEWHVREHIPERVALPGFLRGRRYVAVDGHPKFFNFYETSTTADLASPIYRERLNAPSEWTKKVVAHFVDTSRTICDVTASIGVGEGGFVETLRLSSAVESNEFAKAVSHVLNVIVNSPGIIAAHLLEGSKDASGGSSAEKQLRSEPDQVADWVVLIEAVELEALEKLRSGPSSDAVFATAGAHLPVARASYAFQFGLTKAELAGFCEHEVQEQKIRQ
jgi:hypothetical protein